MPKRYPAKWPYLFVILLFAAGLQVFLPRNAPQEAVRLPSDGGFEVYVQKIYDGDSFRTSAGEVRLLCIDAPEKGRPLNKAATTRLRGLIGGQRVRFAFDTEKHDEYGRMLCHAYRGDTWINEALVSEGLARVYLVEPNVNGAPDLIEAQKKARLQKVGIWSLPAPPPEDYYVRSSNSYRFHRSDCRFARSISSRNRKTIQTRDEALDKGLSPCRQCNP